MLMDAQVKFILRKIPIFAQFCLLVSILFDLRLNLFQLLYFSVCLRLENFIDRSKHKVFVCILIR